MIIHHEAGQIVSGGDPAEVFEPAEGILDAVAPFIGSSVEAEGLLAIAAIGDDRRGAARIEPQPQFALS